MASNLRVDSIVPSTSSNVSIGTATGGVTIPGDLGIAGTLTYEDVTNIDSVGVITARSGIRIGAIGAKDELLHTENSSGNAFHKIEASNIAGLKLKGGAGVNHIISDDSLSFFTNSSPSSGNGGSSSEERLRIASDGDVGIGTNSPVERLHIHKPSATGPFLYITNTSTGVSASDGIQIGYDGTNTAVLKNNEPTDLVFYTSASEGLRITSTGIIDAPTQAGFYARMQNNKANVMGGGASYYTIPFDTDSGSVCYDQNNSYNTSTGLYTVPTGGTGHYVVSTAVCLSSNVYGRGGECWFLVGSRRLFFDRKFFSNAGSGTITGYYGTINLKLTAGQTVGVQGFVSGGSTDVDILGAADSDQITWFTARKIA